MSGHSSRTGAAGAAGSRRTKPAVAGATDFRPSSLDAPAGEDASGRGGRRAASSTADDLDAYTGDSGATALPGDGSAMYLDRIGEQVLAHWEASGDFTEQTLQRCGETLIRFLRRQRALGVREVAQFDAERCREFVHARGANGRPPELTTMHARRTTLRMMFRALRVLGHDVGDPTLDLVLPARTATAARPLTDAEVALCRTSARLGSAGAASLQRAVVWALGEATAISSEISAIRFRDVDDPREPRWVQLPGTRRHDPRLGELTDWGSVMVARQLQVLVEHRLSSATLLTYRGTGVPGGAGAQAAVGNTLGAVLKQAGLAGEPDVRPASLRNWAGRRLFDGGMPIDQVARRMGCRSLDTAAEDIGLQWRGR